MTTQTIRMLLAILAIMFSPAAFAACPSVTFQIPFNVLGVSAGSGTAQDSAGNTWSYTFPAIPPSQQVSSSMTFTPPSTWSCGGSGPAALPAGTYVFSAGGMALDVGCTPAGQYPVNSGPGQKMVWNGSTLANGTNFLSDAGGTPPVAARGTTADTWAIVQSGSGYTVQNVRTGRYLGTNSTACYPPSHPLPMVTSPVVWTAS